jgi:hypothetical protein
MTVGRAKAIISYIWLFFGSIIFALVVYLTLIGKFRFSPGDWDAGLAWVTPLTLPVLGFMVPTWTIGTTKKDSIVLKHAHVFFAAVFLSILYFVGLFYIIWLLPRKIDDIETYVNDVMRTSSWFLGTVQALVIVVIGKFFLEDVSEEESSSKAGSNEHGTRRQRKKREGRPPAV